MEIEAVQAAFELTAAAWPERVALVGAGATWSYGLLDELSARFAGFLSQNGCAPGDVVAIVADRSPAVVCAMLAVLRAGCTFAVLDAAYPQARIAACLDVARPARVLLLGDARALSAAVPTGVPSTEVAPEPSALSTWLATFPRIARRDAAEDDVAYLTFTSGSTRVPKCVATGHAPLPHFVRFHIEAFGLGRDDRFSMVSGLSHDPLLRDVFTPLALGASLHVPAQNALTDPLALFRFFADEAITVCHLTPALGRVVAAGAEERALPDLRRMFWGGDRLTLELVRELGVVAPEAAHVNFYGTTETPQAVAFHRVDPSARSERIPIGRGISDVQLLVLREDGNLAEIDEQGEIAVRTRYLSRGYLHDPAASARRYVDNSRTGDAGDRLYLTGDRGRFLSDGSVEFAGRADDQVKVRGFRVELGDVAAAIRAQEGVDQAIVLASSAPSGEARLLAFVTLRSGSALVPSAIQRSLRATVPRYMEPSGISILPVLPLLPNGKFDRQALLALPVPEPRVTPLPERLNERERALVAIWRDVLGIATVGVHESFYDIGGDSLTALSVLIRMRSQGLDEATCRGLLQGRTIAELAGPPSDAAPSAPPSAQARSRLLLNVFRGIMAILLVGSHWAPWVLRRLPGSLRPLAGPVNVFLNWPTPGFAIAFGMTLGLVYLPLYQRNASRALALLRRGAAFVGAGVALFAVDREIINRFVPDYFPPLGSPLTYYLAALLAAPLLLRGLSRTRFPNALSLTGAAALLAAHVAIRTVPPTMAQWVYLYPLIGKFSLVNLSVGMLVGVTIGMRIGDRPLPRWFIPAGAALVAAGLGLGYAGDGLAGLLGDSNDVEPYKWAFYGGLLLLVLRPMEDLVARLESATSRAGTALKALSVLGQIALPVYVFDTLARDFGKFFEIYFAAWLHVAVTMLAFGVVTVTLFRRVYSLYYGDTPPVPRPLLHSVPEDA
jgi:amino acid adenylation domain-containing protein